MAIASAFFEHTGSAGLARSRSATKLRGSTIRSQGTGCAARFGIVCCWVRPPGLRLRKLNRRWRLARLLIGAFRKE